MLTETPLWPELPTPHQAPPSPRARRAAERRARRRKRVRWVVVVAVVLGLASASGGAYALGLFDQAPVVAHGSSAVLDARAAADEAVTLREQLTVEMKAARTAVEGPDGQAAPKAERRALDGALDDARQTATALGAVTWSTTGTHEQAVALLDQMAVLRADVEVATDALREATRRVVESGRQLRLERAMTGLEHARTDLREATDVGEQAFAESAKIDAATDRESLRAALDQAADLDGRAGELLEKAPGQGSAVSELLAEIEQLAAALSATTAQIEDAAAVVLAGTREDAVEVEAEDAEDAEDAAGSPDTGADAGTAGTDTAPAGTCPEPDQVWTAENGHLSSSELASIPFASSHAVRADVVGGLAELNEAYAAEFGVSMTINSSYRTYAQQEAL
ncbi:hypothetical protein [Promicromonospora aerolata]|uniref:Uncharacterized protein n=1 Tax=Promicromonospora aerolata TaxID=195749 RepID=A0ABW4V7A9_9MICO